MASNIDMAAIHYSLLGLTCNPLAVKNQSKLFQQAANKFDWEEISHIIAEQRIGPLLYWHLREYDIQYPAQAKRLLAASYARQTSIAAVQTEALTEIIKAFSKAGIGSVVIKGGALAHMIYPEPGLRPMDDLDIVILPNQSENSRELLKDLGYSSPAPKSRFEKLHHHLPPALRGNGGNLVGVELHTAVFPNMLADKLSFSDLQRPLTSYKVRGQVMQTLAPAQMLWIQYHGLRILSSPIRTLQLADLIRVAEKSIDLIDWLELRYKHPDLFFAFPALQAFTPLSNRLSELVDLDPEKPRCMQDIGKDYKGWPHRRLNTARSLGKILSLLHDTFQPCEWWARFAYGVPPSRELTNVKFYRHPSTLINQGLRRLYQGPASDCNFFKNPM